MALTTSLLLTRQSVNIRIDLISDTATRPTSAMRQAMAKADVGDEQRGEDPSVNRLCERVTDLLGKEAAVFLPSGIMCNQVAVAVHCRPGDEILTADNAHILQSEGAAVATTCGALVTPIAARNGIYTWQKLQQAIRTSKLRAPKPRLVSIEQTSNRGGGSIWSLETIRLVSNVARAQGLALHLDGARLMNASVASNIPANKFAGPFDSVWLGLTKGLGCPVGAVLAGSKAFIEQAWWWKHRLGGAMRQSGILAAAGLYALDYHIDRLDDDHCHARLFSDLIRELPGIKVEPPEIATNIVLFDISMANLDAESLAAKLLAEGIRIGVESKTRLRAVTHMDINEKAVRTAAAAISRNLGSIV